MKLEQHLQHLETAKSYIDLAIRLNVDIKRNQDASVIVQFDLTMNKDVKDLHIAHYQKYVQEYQDLKADSLKLYAETIQQLIQPTIDKTNAMMLGDLEMLKNGEIVALQGDGDE
jgi:putative sterol carrier protein